MIHAEILSTAEKYSRSLRITKGRKQLSTPTFFPAVSGLAFRFDPKEILKLILWSGYPRVLISCYDVSTYGAETRRMIGEVSNYFRSGSFVMLDSGVFEGYWRQDAKWDFGKYRKALSNIDSDFYFGFDTLPNAAKPRADFLQSTARQISRSRNLSRASEFIPIVHGLTPDHLVSVVRQLLKGEQYVDRTIAVAERDCGQSVIERARTILRIRQLLNDKDETTLLHVLGCGNPISLALFAYCGADTFDSLDWLKLTIDRNELKLADFSHLELLNCTCKVCTKSERDSITKTLLHNLLFYQDFVLRLQSMIARETLWDFLVQYVGSKILDKVSR